jgi:TatD DNase family protein
MAGEVARMDEYLFADAHCHLESCAGLPNPKVLHISSGYSQESNAKNARIASQYANVYFCAGIAPQEAMKHQDAKILLVGWEEGIAALAEGGKLVAIGEIGLDYKWAANEEDKHLQMECFISQLQLAERLGLPVVIHSRDAEDECVEVLQSFNLLYMMHCFSGRKEAAMKACEGRGIISIPPLRSKERKQFIRDLPIEKLVAETDAPYIGKTPADAAESIKMIAEIKGMEEAAVQKQTLLNTASFFRIK